MLTRLACRPVATWIALATLTATLGVTAGWLVARTLRPVVPPCPDRAALAPAPADESPSGALVPADPSPPACRFEEVDPDPARWTMSEQHFGPFLPCDLDELDAAALGAVLPGYEITRVDDPSRGHLEVKRRGTLLLTVYGGPEGPYVVVHDRAIATPWGVRVGDPIRRVRDRHRDLACHYGAAEGDESVVCVRTAIPEHGARDGWRDRFAYELDPRTLTRRDREVLEHGDELPIARFDRFAVKTITWAPTIPESE